MNTPTLSSGSGLPKPPKKPDDNPTLVRVILCLLFIFSSFRLFICDLHNLDPFTTFVPDITAVFLTVALIVLLTKF